MGEQRAMRSALDLARFTIELEKAWVDIVEFKRQPISSVYDLTFIEIDE